jgi:hypothetical protein
MLLRKIGNQKSAGYRIFWTGSQNHCIVTFTLEFTDRDR